MDAIPEFPYYPRSLRPVLGEVLSDTRVVAILGPRQCGKSSFALKHDDSRAYITLDDDDILRAVLADPVGFVKSLPEKVTIDEIQHALPLIRAIKISVDRDNRPGRFILTGSANLLTLPKLSESLAGRMEITNLSRDLKADRATVEKYLGILERLYLVRMLRPWSTNESKRLIKTLKMHFVDCGLAASLSGLKLAHWNTKREDFGHLLESFVEQQIIAQAQWTDPSLRFSHYRDKDQVEVDLVIERGRDIWGVEVKASQSVTDKDGAGLRRLARLAGKRFRGGYLLYNGSMTWPVPGKDGFMAVPLSKFQTL